jgi:heterotetrameric sarcosine oxidase gamma subunit
VADLRTHAEPVAAAPLARSPIPITPPTAVVAGWEVTERSSEAALRLADLSPLAKVQVRAGEDGPLRAHLGVGFLQAAWDAHGVLVTGSGPGEWLLFGPVGSAADIAARLRSAEVDERVTVVDLTHGRALLRLTGGTARDLLAGVCAIDLDDRSVPDGSCLRTSVAKVVTDLVRDDRGGERSYLLHCERSSGAYLASQLLEVGRLHGLDLEGFRAATT